LSSGPSLSLKMALFIRANGCKSPDTDMVYRSGQTERNMRVDGETIWQKVEEFSGTQMVMSLMASGNRIGPTVLGPIRMWMAPSTRVNGNKTCSMAMELKSGKMAALMKANTSRGKGTDMENKNGAMEASLREIGTSTRSMVMAGMFGQMADPMRVTGKMITCMGEEFTLGRTDALTRATTMMIKNTDSEFIHGLMVGSIMACGKMGSSTGKANISYHREFNDEAAGEKESVKNGLMLQAIHPRQLQVQTLVASYRINRMGLLLIKISVNYENLIVKIQI
jgi:hypothetical protein